MKAERRRIGTAPLVLKPRRWGGMSVRRKTPGVLPPRKNPNIQLSGGRVVSRADLLVFRNEKISLDRNSKSDPLVRSRFAMPATLFWLSKKKSGIYKRISNYKNG